MLTAYVLGSGSGLPTARRDTTALLVVAGATILVDCPGGVVHKLARLGVRPGDVDDVILTHDHVDHVYGLAHLVHALAIAGEPGPLPVHAPAATLATVRRIVTAHGLDAEGYPVLDLRPVPGEPAELLHTGELRVTAAPTAHARDTRALRFATTEAALGHSSDTRYHEPLAALFEGVDVLLHDCAGLEHDRAAFADNHSSAREAGELAARAGARGLRLIHLSPDAERDEEALVREAASAYDGPIAVARDGDLYRLPLPAGADTGRRAVR